MWFYRCFWCYYECIISVLVMACVFFFFVLRLVDSYFVSHLGECIKICIRLFSLSHPILLTDFIGLLTLFNAFNAVCVVAERFKSYSYSYCWVLSVIFVSSVVYVQIPPNGNKCSVSVVRFCFVPRLSSCIYFNCVKYFNCRKKKKWQQITKKKRQQRKQKIATNIEAVFCINFSSPFEGALWL